jgi:hypothetical protein
MLQVGATGINQTNEPTHILPQYLLTYVRSWALPDKLPIVQLFRKFPAILRNPKVHHRVHISPPLVPILSQLGPVPTIPSYLSKIHFNIVHPPTSWSSQWSTLPQYIILSKFFERFWNETCGKRDINLFNMRRTRSFCNIYIYIYTTILFRKTGSRI